MKIIGLTGGIASGKNLVADIFAQNNFPVFDADKEVHKLLDSDKSTIAEVKKAFPQSFIAEKIDRKILGKIVFGSDAKMKILERILHPKVRKNYQKFLKQAKKEKAKAIVLNIPLLLESEAYKCDYIIAIITTRKVQKERFINREKAKNPQAKITDLNKRFSKIIKKQFSNSLRKKHANFIIKNDGLKSHTTKQAKQILQTILE